MENNKDKNFMSGRDILDFLNSIKQEKEIDTSTQVVFIYLEHDIKDRIIVYLN